MMSQLSTTAGGSRNCRTLHPYGFTMLELVLALAIIAVVMAAITTASSLFAQYRFRSIEGNRQTKILHGTIEDLRDDLRATFGGEIGFVFDASSRTTTGRPNLVTETTLAADSSIEERVLSFKADELEQPIHFVGRHNAMLLLRKGRGARFAQSDNDHVEDHHILWLAPGVENIRVPSSISNKRVSQKAFSADDRKVGLKRLATRARPRPQGSARLGTLQTEAELYWETNNEIASITFDYFDGKKWRENWDSHLQSDQLPLAVKVVIANRAAKSLSPNDLRSGSVAAQSYRLIIRLPSANRILPTENAGGTK